MLKISESLFDVPIAKHSNAEKVKELTDFILRDLRAQKAAAKALGNGDSEAAASPSVTGKA